MSETTSRLAWLRRLAIACAVLVLAITSLTAFIRLARAGLGCEPWPQCYAQRAALPPEVIAQWDGAGITAARIAHRTAASAALLLVIALLVKSLGGQPMLWRPGRVALALLAVALFLAVLGRLGADSRAPPVVLGNLLGGLAMFALSCRMVQASAPASGMGSAALRLRPWVAAALVLLALQLVLGGLVSASHAGTECGDRAVCEAHRLGGLVLAGVLVPLGVQAWRGGLHAGAAVAVLVLAQLALGLLLLATGLPLAAAVAHNGIAALLLAALLALLRPR